MSTARGIAVAAIVASLSATALLAVAILIFGDFGETEGRILATTALIAGYGLLAFPAAFLFDQSRLHVLAGSLLVLAVGGFSTAVAAVWADDAPGDLWKSVGTITVLALACTQIAAMSARRRAGDPTAVRRLFVVSVVLVLVAAGMATAAIWAEIDSSAYVRALAAVVVLDVLAVVLQPILAFTGPGGAVYRLGVAVEGGEELERTVEARDFATAAATAIREVERAGREVVAVSRRV